MAALKMRQRLEARQGEEEDAFIRVPLSRDQVNIFSGLAWGASTRPSDQSMSHSILLHAMGGGSTRLLK